MTEAELEKFERDAKQRIEQHNEYVDAGANPLILTLCAEVRRLREALSKTRGQWIHSVHAKECLQALGDEK